MKKYEVFYMNCRDNSKSIIIEAETEKEAIKNATEILRSKNTSNTPYSITELEVLIEENKQEWHQVYNALHGSDDSRFNQ